jgi:hypothetical protein
MTRDITSTLDEYSENVGSRFGTLLKLAISRKKANRGE